MEQASWFTALASQVIQAYSSAHSCRTELLPSTLPHYCFFFSLPLSYFIHTTTGQFQPISYCTRLSSGPTFCRLLLVGRPYFPRAEIFMRMLADKKKKALARCKLGQSGLFCSGLRKVRFMISFIYFKIDKPNINLIQRRKKITSMIIELFRWKTCTSYFLCAMFLICRGTDHL